MSEYIQVNFDVNICLFIYITSALLYYSRNSLNITMVGVCLDLRWKFSEICAVKSEFSVPLLGMNSRRRVQFGKDNMMHGNQDVPSSHCVPNLTLSILIKPRNLQWIFAISLTLQIQWIKLLQVIRTINTSYKHT